MGKNSSWQIKAGAIMSYVAIAVNIIAGFVYTPWMINTIGESTYGLYTLATSLISLFVMDFGISSATARYVARYRAEGNVEKANRFLGMVYKLYTLIDAVIAVVFLFVYFNVGTIYSKLSAEEIDVFKGILVIIIFYNLIALPLTPLDGVLNAYENFFHMKLAGCLNKVLTVLSTFAVLALGGGIFSLVIIHVVFNLLAMIYRLVVVKCCTPVRANLRAWDKGELKGIFAFSLWATVVSITARLIFNITPSILAAFVSTAAVTAFGIASTLEGYVFIFSDAINGLFLPKATRASLSEHRDTEIFRLMTRVGRISLSVVALIVLGFAVAGRDFVALWMGDGFEDVYICTLLMILPNVIYYPQQIGHTMLLVDNKIKYQAFIYIIMGAFNVAASFLLIPFLGVFGSAISITITYCIRFVLMTVVFQKILKLNMASFYFNCYVKMLVPIVATTLFGFFIFDVWAQNTWITFFAKCSVVVAVYFLLMWICGWNRDEKNLIKGIAGALFRKFRRNKTEKI